MKNTISDRRLSEGTGQLSTLAGPELWPPSNKPELTGRTDKSITFDATVGSLPLWSQATLDGNLRLGNCTCKCENTVFHPWLVESADAKRLDSKPADMQGRLYLLKKKKKNPPQRHKNGPLMLQGQQTPRCPIVTLLRWEMVLCKLGSEPHSFQVQHFLAELGQRGLGMTYCLLCVSGMCLV